MIYEKMAGGCRHSALLKLSHYEITHYKFPVTHLPAFSRSDAAAKDRFSVIERREVEERRHNFLRWRNNGTARIGDRVEHAVVKVLIAVADLILSVFQQGLEFVGVFVDGIGEIVEVVRQYLGI